MNEILDPAFDDFGKVDFRSAYMTATATGKVRIANEARKRGIDFRFGKTPDFGATDPNERGRLPGE